MGWLLVCAAGIVTATGVLTFTPASLSPVSGQSTYSLFFRFEIPRVIPGLSLAEGATKRTYTGTLLGTLGGVPLTAASYTYGNGASQWVGGGTFSMTTKVGPVQDGQIFMTSDGKQTSLLFFAKYLGTRLSFSIVGKGDQIGGIGMVATGLAETGFRSHEQYVAAIREAMAALPSPAREQVLAQADQNLRLVREYIQKTPSP
jgi:hypothetical protein